MRKVEIFFIKGDLSEQPILEVTLTDDGKLREKSLTGKSKLADFLIRGEFVHDENLQFLSVKKEPKRAFMALPAHFSGSRVRAREMEF